MVWKSHRDRGHPPKRLISRRKNAREYDSENRPRTRERKPCPGKIYQRCQQRLDVSKNPSPRRSGEVFLLDIPFYRTCLEQLIEESLRLPDPRPWPHSVPDTKDAIFLALAHASGAWLVTGNLKHFPKPGRHGVTVLSPTEYLDHLGE